MIRLLADEHFPMESVFFQRDAGYDIKALLLECPGADDKEIITWAITEQRIIITYDRDYGELIFKNKLRPPQGVIYLQKIMYDDTSPGEIVSMILSSSEFSTDFRLTVYDGTLWRQRGY